MYICYYLKICSYTCMHFIKTFKKIHEMSYKYKSRNSLSILIILNQLLLEHDSVAITMPMVVIMTILPQLMSFVIRVFLSILISCGIWQVLLQHVFPSTFPVFRTTKPTTNHCSNFLISGSCHQSVLSYSTWIWTKPLKMQLLVFLSCIQYK